MSRKGFTLIELVMVIVIIGILAAVAIPKFMSLKTEAERARCEADVGAIRTGISSWYAKYHVSTNNRCPSQDYGGASGECNAAGFPVNLTGTKFANATFVNAQMPPDSHIANASLSPKNWDTPYDAANGTYNMAMCCNSTE